MAEIRRTGSASWNGGLKDGKGNTSTGAGGINALPYSFHSRFENAQGTNPEELIAAAHASCFSMALSKILGDEGHAPTSINTRATLSMVPVEGGFKIKSIHLDTEGRVPGLDSSAFLEAAEKAKENCPVSILLKPGLEQITLDAKLG
jgi:lipoyl-dependent peroxiredoxin